MWAKLYDVKAGKGSPLHNKVIAMDKGLRALRQRCESRLENLDVPVPFDSAIFCRTVEAERGRSIILSPIASRNGPCGLWIAGRDCDFIFYEAETSRLHQDHIILHELSHIICGHQPVPLAETEYLQLLCPSLSPEIFRHVLRRMSYSAEEDREAEMLASLVLLQASAKEPSTLNPNRASTSLHDRLKSCLENGTGGDA